MKISNIKFLTYLEEHLPVSLILRFSWEEKKRALYTLNLHAQISQKKVVKLMNYFIRL